MSVTCLVTDAQAIGQTGAGWLVERLKGHREALIALSGGSAPQPIYKALSALDPGEFKLTVVMADERLVPLNHTDSNFRQLMESLLHQWPVFRDGRCHVLTPPVDLPGDEACRQYDTMLRTVLDTQPGGLSVAVLGCGPDGHTASLFPHHSESRSCGLVEYVWNSPKPPAERISLSETLLLQAEHILFVARGKEKAEIVRTCIQDADAHRHLPAARISASHPSVTWLLDQEAASRMG